MKVTIKVTKEIDIKTLEAKAGVRYWEDATVNGVEDAYGTLIPCKNGEMWCPIIDIETGTIKNWATGTTANIHYKVCDNGIYTLHDADGNEVLKINGYVPDIMCPNKEGYGDYIKMTIDENGKILNWKADEYLLKEFEKLD